MFGLSAAKLESKIDLVDSYRSKFIETITGYIPIIIYVYSLPDFETLFSTYEISNVLGFTTEEVLIGGKDFTKGLFHPEDLEMVYQNIQKTMLLADEDVNKFRYRMRKKDQSYIWFYTEERVFDRDEKGNATKVIGFAKDITETIHFINTLQEKNEQLAEIAFINSHHVRGPVATILGLVELYDLNEEMPEELNAKIIDGLKVTANRLDVAIKQIIRQAEKIEEEGAQASNNQQVTF
jgi:PAS domain S-box-containing protein